MPPLRAFSNNCAWAICEFWSLRGAGWSAALPGVDCCARQIGAAASDAMVAAMKVRMKCLFVSMRFLIRVEIIVHFAIVIDMAYYFARRLRSQVCYSHDELS